MNEKLQTLIFDFQDKIQVALKLMQRSGIPMPYSLHDWIELDLSNIKELSGGIRYYRHGAGCKIMLDTGTVDFDFGTNGEIGGFNFGWLKLFAGEKLSEYGFRDDNELAKCLRDALSEGELICEDDDLCYITDAPCVYASDIDCRDVGDMLPSRNKDPVLVLYIYYFQAADLMLKNHEKLGKKWDKAGRVSRRDRNDMGIYLSTWLGFLAVVCEGLKNLKMRILLSNDRPDDFKELLPLTDKLGRLMNKHAHPLREFRNDTFHLRKNVDVVRSFFDEKSDRLLWAFELHTSLSHFFSEYRILCEVHYVLNGRKGEADFARKERPPRR